MRKYLVFVIPIFFLLIGVVIGGYLFAQSQPRSFLSLHKGKIRLTKRELAGLVASAGIQQLPGFIPSVVFETDRTIVITSPTPEARLDYVFFPKKDIKNIGEITKEDSEFLMDAYLAARHIIETKNYQNYRFYTNGPGHQKITYLHFHLLID
jgi:hypothetical protein